MKILADQLYHIYNQGNNQETIFQDRNDYIHFLRKFREKTLPYCEVMSYCLMPNHFHFLINATNDSASTILSGNVETTQLANGFRLLTSSYATEYNKKYNRTGSLFRQRTKAKNLEDDPKAFCSENYPFICFHYIHQNPMVAGLCNRMEDWEFSSFQDYYGLRNGTLISKHLAYELIGVSEGNFYNESYQFIDEDKIKGIYES